MKLIREPSPIPPKLQNSAPASGAPGRTLREVMKEMEVNRFRTMFSVVMVVILVALIFAVGCGSNSPSSTAGMGSANVTLSDPPSCTEFDHVYVTIDGVSATTSSSDTGWQELATQLSSSAPIKAVQLDLMNLSAQGQQQPIQCLLAQLGSTQSLPVGDYGQIRLMLVPNNTSQGGVTLLSGSVDPANNKCSSVNAWNCVVEHDTGATTALNLSSQAQTGLKIPPGQVMGGPIHVAAGQSVDLNIDFNGCRSVVAQGNSQFRLDPVLVAYQVSQNLTGISGQVVEGSFGANGFGPSTTPVTPVADANVALEKTSSIMDGSFNVDTISNWLTATDTSGNFNFCPLPAGPFDIVADAGASGSTSGNFNATIVKGVQNGNKVTVPLLPETGGPATLTGSVSATSSGSGSFTAYLFAVQEAATDLEFAVPLLSSGLTPGSTPQVNVSCPSGTCASTAFTLVVPASNPVVGTFSAGSITWPAQAPAASPINYKVEATCLTGSGPIGTFSTPATAVTAGTSTALAAGQPPQLTGCTAQ